MALVVLINSFRPPYQHSEAMPTTDYVNNSEQVSPKSEPVVTPVTQEQPKVEPVSQPVEQPKPVFETVAAHPVGCSNYSALIAQYDWNVNVMTAICYAESSGNPNAVGDTWAINRVYAPSCGLFQIRTLAGRPSCEELKNPQTNIEWAYKIYKGQGYPAWSVCRTKVSCY